MNTDNKPDPLAGYGSSRMDAAETQVDNTLASWHLLRAVRQTHRSINLSVVRLSVSAAPRQASSLRPHQRPARSQRRNAHPDTAQTDQLEGFTQGTQLFGQHIGSGSHLIITEGEIDAMSVHEAYCARTKGVVAVSITSGVNACLNNLKANLKYINSFDRVTVFFDDEPENNDALARSGQPRLLN